MNAPARNNIAAGRALLAAIDAWCLRTGTPEAKIGGILFRHPGFVGLLRKRLIVTEDSERAVRDFLAQYPMGANHLDSPNPKIRVPGRSAAEAQSRRLANINGPSCKRCGRTDPDACSYPSCPRRSAA